MPHVIAIANTKGGVGKSTLTVNLAAQAAGEGNEVLIVDADPQASALQFLEVREDDRPAVHGVQITKPILHRQLPKLAEPFDLVLIDVPGRDAPVFRSALVAADTILVPMVPAAFDTWASADVFAVVDELAAADDDLRTYVVLNQVTRTVVAREALEHLIGYLREHNAALLDTQIYNRTAWARSSGEGLSVCEWEPRGSAALELRLLSIELGVVGNEAATAQAAVV